MLDLGRYDVSVPRDHKMGSVERPTIWTMFRENPEQHFVITSRKQESYDEFYAGKPAPVSEVTAALWPE